MPARPGDTIKTFPVPSLAAWLWVSGAVVFRVLLALLLSLLFTTAVIAPAGGDPRAALTALWEGAFGSPYALGSSLVRATPLLLTGLGVAVALQARLWNIGGEGQFLMGALGAAFLASRFGPNPTLPSAVILPVLLAASALAGAIWAALAALLKTLRGVPEVIATIMLNFVAAELLSYLVNGPMQRADHTQPATEPLSSAASLPLLSDWLPRLPPSPLHLGFGLALIAAVLTAVFLSRTATGFTLKVVGANAEAARLAGIDVPRAFVVAMLWSGGLCGLAGGVELTGVVGFIPEGYDPGYGFTAIAVALLGRMNPVGIVFSALFFGALGAGCDNMERMAGIAHEIGYIIQAFALLALLASQWPGWGGLLVRATRRWKQEAPAPETAPRVPPS